MARYQSDLILRLVDHISRPARVVRNSLVGLGGAIAGVGGRQNITGMQAMGKHLGRIRYYSRDIAAGLSLPAGMVTWFGADAVYQFEKAGNAMQAYGLLTEQQRSNLEKYALELNKKYSFDARQIIEATQELFRAGLSYEQARGALKGTLNLALIGNGDISNRDAADIATNVMTAMKLPMATSEQVMESMQRVNDALAHAATTSNTNIKLMGDTFRYVAPLAAVAGMELETVAAISAELARNGIKGSEAGVALRSALVRMAKPTKPMLKAFARLGIDMKDFVKYSEHIDADSIIGALGLEGLDMDVLQNIKGDLQAILDDPAMRASTSRMTATLTDIIANAYGDSSIIGKESISNTIAEAVLIGAQKVDLVKLLTTLREKGATITDIAQIFDVRMGSRLAAILSSDLEEAIDLFKKKYGHASDRMADLIMQGIVRDLAEMRSAFFNLFIAISETGVMANATKAINFTTESLIRLANSSPKLLEWGTYAAVALAVIGPFGMALGGLVSLIKLAAVPVQMLAAAIYALAGASALATGADMLDGKGGKRKGGMGKRLGKLGFKATGIGTGIWLANELLEILTGKGIVDTTLGENFGKTIANGMTASEELKSMKQDLADIDQQLANIQSKSKSPDMIPVLSQPLEMKRRQLVEDIAALEQQIKAQGALTGSAMGAGMQQGVLMEIPGLVEAINKAVAQMQGAANAGVQIPIMAATGAIPIPTARPDGKRRHGGPMYPGRTYLTGEEGPELISVGSTARVHNARQSAQMASGGGVTIGPNHFHMPNVKDPQAAARAIESKLKSLLGRTRQLSLEGRPVTT